MSELVSNSGPFHISLFMLSFFLGLSLCICPCALLSQVHPTLSYTQTQIQIYKLCIYQAHVQPLKLIARHNENLYILLYAKYSSIKKKKALCF